MTTATARRLGYEVGRGAYRGTTDDRADRWYIWRRHEPTRRIGAGYPMRAEALARLGEWLAFEIARGDI